MVEYNPYPRDGDNAHPNTARPNERIHETTVVRSSNSSGAIAAIVLFIVLAVGAFAFWSANEAPVNTTTDTAPAISEQVAPDPAIDPARPVPAPDAPAIEPAAPETTAPAPAPNP
jgi:hypothetical protein